MGYDSPGGTSRHLPSTVHEVRRLPELRDGLTRKWDGWMLLVTSSNGLQPNSDGLQPNSVA